MDLDTRQKRELSLVTWKDVRTDVLRVNKTLGEIIDAIDPNSNYKFIKATYLYGDQFIKNGIALFPNAQELVPLSHHTIDKKIQKELSYNSFPLLIMLDKDNELFVDTGSRIIPINLFRKGNLTGVYETMDFLMEQKSKSIWNFSAGSRSIFMLPKITDKLGLKKLSMKYDIPATIQIKSLSDHWELFKSVAQNKNFTQHWQNIILFFGEKWLIDQPKSKDWERFKYYLLQQTWKQATYAIDKLKFNLCWERFAEIISLRRLQPKPYLIDQVKHLLSIIAGNFPAFIPINSSQESAPVKGLQEIFAESYVLLKQYLPTLMHACMLNDSVANPRYVYYSLSLPTILEGSPLKKTTATIVSDMREIKLLVETLKNPLRNKLDLEVNTVIQDAEIEYFHYEKDICGQIRPSSNILIEDPAFLKDNAAFPSLSFCPSSPFFSGCIRIASKKKIPD